MYINWPVMTILVKGICLVRICYINYTKLITYVASLIMHNC